MAPSLVALAPAAWLVAAILALVGRGLAAARGLLVVGAAALIAAALALLPGGLAPIATPLGLPPAGSTFALAPEALWLMGFGLPGALLAAWLAHAVGGGPRLDLRRCGEPDRCARRVRHAGRRHLPRRLGDHEPRRRRHDSRRAA